MLQDTISTNVLKCHIKNSKIHVTDATSDDLDATPATIAGDAIGNKQLDAPDIDKRVSVESTLLENTLLSNTDQDSFYVSDLGDVIRQYKQWKLLMPRVKPFYGIIINSCQV